MGDLPEQKIEEIKEAFELLSKDGDNKVHYCQIGDIVRALGECPTNEDVTKFLGDPSKEDMQTKKMSCEEFIPIFCKIINEALKGTFEDFMEGMRVFDKDGNGTVMGAEIRHVLTTLGEKLTAAQVSEMMQGQEDSSGVIVYADINEAFELYSKDGDNKIHLNQVGDVVRALGECPTNEDVDKFLGMPSLEDMQNKKLTAEEFLPIFAKIISEALKGTFEDFMEGLRVFDKDGDGTVMGAEIRHVLTTLGEKLTSTEVSTMMQGHEDASGILVYADFCKFLIESPQ